MYTTTLSSKYQISIPKGIRDELSVKAGQKFLFIRKGNVIMLVPQLNIKDFKGIMAGAKTDNVRDRRDRV